LETEEEDTNKHHNSKISNHQKKKKTYIDCNEEREPSSEGRVPFKEFENKRLTKEGFSFLKSKNQKNN